MRYFKIRIGYGTGEDHHVEIDETELEKAYLCFLTDAKAVFSGGPVRGKDIVSISEDWHRALGWNREHSMGPDDWHEVNERLPDYRGILAAVKEKVTYLIKANRQDLIGQNVDIPDMSFGPKGAIMPAELTGQVAALAESKRI